MYNDFKYVPAMQDVEKLIHNITYKLEAKLTEVFSVLNQTKDIIEKYFYSQDGQTIHTTVLECSRTTKAVLTEFEIFQGKNVLNNSYSEENFSIDHGKFFS